MHATIQPTRLGIAVIVIVLLAVAARIAGGATGTGAVGNATPVVVNTGK